MCKANAMDNAIGPGCSEGNSTKTGAGTINNTNMLEGVEGKINIITPDKINKISILVSY